MRKISNNQSNVLIGPRVPKVVSKREDIKESLGEIEKLSSEIDKQFKIINQEKQSLIKQQEQHELSREKKEEEKEIEDYYKEYKEGNSNRSIDNIYNNTNSHEFNQEEEEEDEESSESSSSINRAVELSIRQYYYRMSEIETEIETNDNNSNINKINKNSPNEEYQKYRHVIKFNKDFLSIKEKLEMLRKLTLFLEKSEEELETYQKYQETYQKEQETYFKIENESDIVKIIKNIMLTQSHNKNNKNINKSTTITTINNNSNKKKEPEFLGCINKLEQINQLIEEKLEHLLDDIEYKKRVIEELRLNENNTKDDMEILESRNIKLRKELSHYKIIKNDKINYGGCHNISSSEEEEEEQCFGEEQSANDTGQEEYEQSQQEEEEEQQEQEEEEEEEQEQEQEEQHKTCEQEYLELMEQYNLYNREEQTINKTFPKNKTEAMLLLNQLDNQINQLSLKKTLQLYNHTN